MYQLDGDDLWQAKIHSMLVHLMQYQVAVSCIKMNSGLLRAPQQLWLQCEAVTVSQPTSQTLRDVGPGKTPHHLPMYTPQAQPGQAMGPRMTSSTAATGPESSKEVPTMRP